MYSCKKRFRWIMLGMLCAGLLLMGVGAGVAFAEYSSFTYAGERLPENARLQNQSVTAMVDPEADKIVISGYGTGACQLAGIARIEVGEDLEPGTVRMDFQYQSVGPKLHVSWDGDPLASTIRVYWDHQGSGIWLMMTYKDQVLEDIRNHRLGDYVALQLTEAVITVNPADAEKIVLD